MIDFPANDPVHKVSVSIRRSQYRALEVIAVEQRKGRSRLIQDALDLYLNDEHGKRWASAWLPRAYRDFTERIAELKNRPADELEEVA